MACIVLDIVFLVYFTLFVLILINESFSLTLYFKFHIYAIFQILKNLKSVLWLFEVMIMDSLAHVGS